ncbi:MAG: hypothetical protein PUH21_06545 [Prevotellaceae bacterium]|nr:hypothetical protein [Prevotellaceae bacterium]MDY3855678.1 hypothetical protein [Bacteroidaceae bacterium]
MKYRIILFLLFNALLLPVVAAPQPDEPQPPIGEQRYDGKVGMFPWNHMHPKDKQGRHFAPWAFIKDEENFIIQKAGLTQAEANSIFPLLHRQKDAQRKCDEQIRGLEFQARTLNLTDQVALENLGKIRALQAKSLSIECKYQAQILKYISPGKYLRVLSADKQFDRMMLRRMMMDKHKEMFLKDKRSHRATDGK